MGAKKAALGIKGAKLIGAGLFKKAAVGAKTVAVKAGVGALALGTKAVVGGKILGGKAKLAAPMVLVPAAGMKLAGGMAGGILEKSGIANVPKAVLGALGSPALGVAQVLTSGALVPEAAAMGAAEPRDDQFVLVRLGGVSLNFYYLICRFL